MIRGIDLKRLLAGGRVPSVAEACGWIQQAAEILDLLHERGLVHRDIKPSNIMLAEDGQVHLLDFGLARLPQREDQTSLTGEGDVFGTLEYMATEALADTGRSDIRSDLFSLGRTLDQLLGSRAPLRLQKIIDRLQRSDPAQRVSDAGRSRRRPGPLRQGGARSFPPPAPGVHRHPGHPGGSRLRLQRPSSGRPSIPIPRAPCWPIPSTIPLKAAGSGTSGCPPSIRPSRSLRSISSTARRGFAIAALVSYRDLPDPLVLTFRWKWTKGQQNYCDVLSLGLRTSGGLHDQWPHGLSHGIQVDFTPSTGEVQFVDLIHPEVSAFGRGVAMPQNEWLSVRIVDDGQQISIYLDDSPEPIVSGPAPYPSTHHRIVFYNREGVGGIEKESLLDDIRIEARAITANRSLTMACRHKPLPLGEGRVRALLGQAWTRAFRCIANARRSIRREAGDFAADVFLDRLSTPHLAERFFPAWR